MRIQYDACVNTFIVGDDSMKAIDKQNRNYSGSAKLASKKEVRQRMNKAYVCHFFDVRANTPDDILAEAIKRLTGESMSFGAFKHNQLTKKPDFLGVSINQKRNY